MQVFISFISIGTDAGPFNLYSDVDGFTSAFETGVTRQQLLDGFASSNAPDGTNFVKVLSTGVCQTSVLLFVPGGITTTTTTTLTPTTTSTTTAGPFYEYTQNVTNCASCGVFFIAGNVISAIALVPGKWYYDSMFNLRINPIAFVRMSAGPVNSNISLASQQDTCSAVVCPTTTTTSTIPPSTTTSTTQVPTTTTTTTHLPYFNYLSAAGAFCNTCGTIGVTGGFTNEFALTPGKWFYDTFLGHAIQVGTFNGYVGSFSKSLVDASLAATCAAVVCPTTTTTTTVPPTTTTTTTKQFFVFTVTVGNGTSSSACTDPGFPNTRYAGVSTWANGVTIYTNSALTSVLNGNNLWFKNNAALGTAWQISSGGVILANFTCPATTTTTTTKVTAFAISVGNANNNITCDQLSYPTTVYSSSAVLANGSILYTSNAMTTRVNGFDQWYKEQISTKEWLVSTVGVLSGELQCAPPTTTTTTTIVAFSYNIQRSAAPCGTCGSTTAAVINNKVALTINQWYYIQSLGVSGRVTSLIGNVGTFDNNILDSTKKATCAEVNCP